jgi:subtilisin family serine protease
MKPLELVRLIALMELTEGRSEVVVGLVDGPIAMHHPDLTGNAIREVPGKMSGACTTTSSTACLHATFVAGILCAKRGSAAPALCPNCTLLAYPVFAETASGNTDAPSANPEDLTAAILACIDAGARILNLSLALTQSTTRGARALGNALDHAARRGVIIVAAAGNQRVIGSTAITGHPWVIPVVACDLRGKPIDASNLGHSIGLRGLRAPGDQITSLGAQGQALTQGGTSVAAPFVTGAIALIWSLFPAASGSDLRLAVLQAHARARASITPPLLDAWAAYEALRATHSRR